MARRKSNATTWECVRTYYVDSDVQPGDTITWSRWHDRPYPGSQPFNLITLATVGDYNGSTDIERSNLRSLLRDTEIGPHLVRVTGGYGTESCGYLGTEPPCDELHEALDALDSYPILDEMDCSEMESEMESDAWESYGCEDFRKALITVLDEIDPAFEHTDRAEDLDPTQLWHTWRDGCEAFNVNGGDGKVIESGGSVHFYIDEWAKDAASDGRSIHEWARKAHAAMRRDLLKLAHDTRGALVPGEDDELDLAIEAFTIACTRLLASVPAWTPTDASEHAIARCNAIRARLAGPSEGPSKEGLLAA